MVGLNTADLARAEALVERAVGGEPSAPRELVELLWPSLVEWVKHSRSLGALAHSEDPVHDVVTRVVEKIGAPGGRGLRLYRPWRDSHPDKTLFDWLRIVTTNLVRDYVREQLGPLPNDQAEPSPKRLLNEIRSAPRSLELGVRPPFTLTQTARQILDFAQARLPQPQLQVLAAWLEGGAYQEMAAELGQGAEESRKLLRAAIATLRREFGVTDQD